MPLLTLAGALTHKVAPVNGSNSLRAHRRARQRHARMGVQVAGGSGGGGGHALKSAQPGPGKFPPAPRALPPQGEVSVQLYLSSASDPPRPGSPCHGHGPRGVTAVRPGAVAEAEGRASHRLPSCRAREAVWPDSGLRSRPSPASFATHGTDARNPFYR